MISKYGPSLSKAVGPVDPSFLVVKNLTLIKLFILQQVYELHKTESTCRLSIQLNSVLFVGQANSADPDQNPASDQGLHCLRTDCSIKI